MSSEKTSKLIITKRKLRRILYLLSVSGLGSLYAIYSDYFSLTGFSMLVVCGILLLWLSRRTATTYDPLLRSLPTGFIVPISLFIFYDHKKINNGDTLAALIPTMTGVLITFFIAGLIQTIFVYKEIKNIELNMTINN